MSFVKDFTLALLRQGSSSTTAKTTNSAEQTYQDAVASKVIALDTTTSAVERAKAKRSHAKSVRSQDASGQAPAVTSKKRKREEVKRRKIPLAELEKNLKYADFLALNQMWREYIATLRGSLAATSPVFAEKLIRADFHGALVKVVRSTSPTAVGLQGIVLIETRNTFRVITTANKVKTFSKAGSVFACEVDNDALIQLFGNQLCQRPAERAAKKYKQRNSVDL